MKKPKVKRPSYETLQTAIAWLRANDGDNGELDSCLAVAEWLTLVMEDSELRNKARKGGVPIAALRQRLGLQP